MNIGQADSDDYDEMAALGWDAAAASVTIDNKFISSADATATVSTTQTLADATWVVFTVLIDGNGNVRYQINDAALTVEPTSKTFIGKTLLMPFFDFVVGGDNAPGAITISHWDVGWGQPDRRLV